MNKTLKQIRFITKTIKAFENKNKFLNNTTTYWQKTWQEFRKINGDKKALQWFNLCENFHDALRLLKLSCDGGSVEVSEKLFMKFSFNGYRRHIEKSPEDRNDRYFLATDEFVENYHRSGGMWGYHY